MLATVHDGFYFRLRDYGAPDSHNPRFLVLPWMENCNFGSHILEVVWKLLAQY